MFRKMRRFKQQLTDEETIQILKNQKQAVLSVQGEDGYPYGVPINYVYSNGKIYFHGAKSGHKVDAMAKDPKVSLTVIDKDTVVPEELTTYFRSVIVFGKARLLTDDDEMFEACKVFGMKYYENEDAVEKEIRREWRALGVYEIEIDHMTGKEAIELVRMRQH